MNFELSSEERHHLVLMVKNGSVKTSLLEDLQKRLSAMNYYHWERATNAGDRQPYNQYKIGVKVLFNDEENLDKIFAESTLITADFPAVRKFNIIMVPYPDLCRSLNFPFINISFTEHEKIIETRTDCKGIHLDIYVADTATNRSLMSKCRSLIPSSSLSALSIVSVPVDIIILFTKLEWNVRLSNLMTVLLKFF